MATDAPFAPAQIHAVSLVFEPAGVQKEFRNAVQSFQFQPQQSISQVTGGTPTAVYTDITPATWQAVLKFLQDSETQDALTDYLFDNAGQVKRCNFVPYGQTGWGADLFLPAPPIGGDLNTWLADTVTFGVKGKPFRIAANGTPTA